MAKVKTKKKDYANTLNRVSTHDYAGRRRMRSPALVLIRTLPWIQNGTRTCFDTKTNKTRCDKDEQKMRQRQTQDETKTKTRCNKDKDMTSQSSPEKERERERESVSPLPLDKRTYTRMEHEALYGFG
jgi:hypothetical protein